MTNKLIITKYISITTSCLILFNGCASTFEQNMGRIGGTTIGAGVGAAIGKEIAGDAGMLIGAVIGGGIGYVIGNEIDKRRANLNKLAKEENLEVLSQNVVESNNQVVSQNIDKGNVDKKIVGDSFTVFSNEEQFALNSSNLNKRAEDIFTKVAKEYKNSDKKILIIGHTDDSGSSVHNQKLSEDRAKNVGDIFVQNGFQKSNIYYLGAGENNPIANNNTVDGAKKNRRVEIVELKDENEIIKYASKTSNPEFFRKVETKVVTSAKSNKNEIVRKVNSVKTDEKEIQSKEIVQKNQVIPDKRQVSTSKVRDIFDFKGKKVVDNKFALKTNFGESIQSNDFSIFTKAQANNATNFYQNCLTDKPRVKADVKSLETNKAIYKTIDYKKGLNNVPFVTNIEKTLIAINPVAVLENSSSSVNAPKVSFYKDYKGEEDIEPTLELLTSVNTYQGTNGLIYRIFFENNDTQMKCIDIVFDEKNVNNSKGVIYYTKNNQVLERDFKIARVK